MSQMAGGQLAIVLIRAMRLVVDQIKPLIPAVAAPFSTAPGRAVRTICIADEAEGRRDAKSSPRRRPTSKLS